MKLDNNVNYIVSGLERSGTSMLMQILEAGKVPVFFDNLRQSDENNPKGYYELEEGKIINKLINKTINLDNFKGKFIKITTYGLKFLPKGKYKIIYSERNIEEILNSMERMANINDENRDDTKRIFLKLNEMIKKQMSNRSDIDFLLVNYNDMIANPRKHIKNIQEFLGLSETSLENMVKVVDGRLYRERNKSIV